jgi:hypothetical protein
LGNAAGAFVDGELHGAQMAWAWSHYRSCARCAEAVDDQRAVRAMLGTDRGPLIPPDVLVTLYAMGSQARPAAAPAKVLVGAAVAQPPAAPEAAGRPASPGHAARPEPTRRRPRRRTTVAGAAAAAALLGLPLLTWVLGGWDVEGEEIVAGARHLAGTNANLEAAAAGEPSGADESQSRAVLAWARANGWPVPDQLPEGMLFAGFESNVFGSDRDHAVLDIAAGSGRVWVLMWRDTPVKAASLDGLDAREVGGRTVYFSREAGRQSAGLWLSGHDLMVFVSDASEADIGEIVKGSPPAAQDTIEARIARGWFAAGHIVRELAS